VETLTLGNEGIKVDKWASGVSVLRNGGPIRRPQNELQVVPACWAHVQHELQVVAAGWSTLNTRVAHLNDKVLHRVAYRNDVTAKRAAGLLPTLGKFDLSEEGFLQYATSDECLKLLVYECPRLLLWSLCLKILVYECPKILSWSLCLSVSLDHSPLMYSV
jgi:hypothetical protein